MLDLGWHRNQNPGVSLGGHPESQNMLHLDKMMIILFEGSCKAFLDLFYFTLLLYGAAQLLVLFIYYYFCDLAAVSTAK